MGVTVVLGIRIKGHMTSISNRSEVTLCVSVGTCGARLVRRVSVGRLLRQRVQVGMSDFGKMRTLLLTGSLFVGVIFPCRSAHKQCETQTHTIWLNKANSEPLD